LLTKSVNLKYFSMTYIAEIKTVMYYGTNMEKTNAEKENKYI